jgi:hypothetical protein
MPKHKLSNIVTSLSRLTGQKYPGLVMLIMVTLDGIPQVRKILFAQLLWWTLFLNVCLNKIEKTSKEVDELDHKVL